MRLLTIVAAAVVFATTVSAVDLHLYEESGHVRTAHAVLGGLAFALFFPLGSIGIRLFSFPESYLVHATWMLFTYCLVIACTGMGIWMASMFHKLNHYHCIIGLLVAAGLLLQSVSGLLHHSLYKKSGSPNAATYPHVWWGRAIVTLGIINGGLALQRWGQKMWPSVAYGVLAVGMWVLWVGVVFVTSIKSRERQEEGDIVGVDAIRLGDKSSPPQIPDKLEDEGLESMHVAFQ